MFRVHIRMRSENVRRLTGVARQTQNARTEPYTITVVYGCHLRPDSSRRDAFEGLGVQLGVLGVR